MIADGFQEVSGWLPANSDCCHPCLRKIRMSKQVGIPFRDGESETQRGGVARGSAARCCGTAAWAEASRLLAECSPHPRRLWSSQPQNGKG